MTAPSCQSPLAWTTLLEYWLGELDSDTETRTEEHYLGCADCSERLAWLTDLARESRALTRASGVSLVLDGAFVARLRQQGLQVREYVVPRDGVVNCTVTPEDDWVVARMEASLVDVSRLDMVLLDSDGGYAMRHEDIPFVAQDGAVVFSMRIDQLRALPQTRLCMRMLAVDESAERTLGDYTFNHSPHRS